MFQNIEYFLDQKTHLENYWRGGINRNQNIGKISKIGGSIGGKKKEEGNTEIP